MLVDNTPRAPDPQQDHGEVARDRRQLGARALPRQQRRRAGGDAGLDDLAPTRTGGRELLGHGFGLSPFGRVAPPAFPAGIARRSRPAVKPGNASRASKTAIRYSPPAFDSHRGPWSELRSSQSKGWRLLPRLLDSPHLPLA